MTETADLPPESYFNVSPVYEYGPDGTKFDRPVKVEMPVKRDREAVTVYWSEEGGSEYIQREAERIDKQTVAIEVTHFSSGFVGEKTRCETDADCASHEECVNGYCEPKDCGGDSANGVCKDPELNEDGICEPPPSYEDPEETCDQKDNDCDGNVDEKLGETFYEDKDGDGFGVESSTTTACSAPDGYASESGDCDDDDISIHPDASEQCNGRDDDCDGEVDEQCAGGFTELLGSQRNEVANDAVVDASGNLYVVGKTRGEIQSADNPTTDAFVAKFAANGDKKWVRQFGGETRASPQHRVVKHDRLSGRKFRRVRSPPASPTDRNWAGERRAPTGSSAGRDGAAPTRRRMTSRNYSSRDFARGCARS